MATDWLILKISCIMCVRNNEENYLFLYDSPQYKETIQREVSNQMHEQISRRIKLSGHI